MLSQFEGLCSRFHELMKLRRRLIFQLLILSGTVIMFEKWHRNNIRRMFAFIWPASSAQYFAGFAKLNFESISVLSAVDVNTAEDC